MKYRKRRKTETPKISNSDLAKHLNSEYTPIIQELKQTDRGVSCWFYGRVPSVNRLTLNVHKTHRRVSTSEVKHFKRAVKEALRKAQAWVPHSEFYELSIWFARTVYDNAGKIVKWDASNFLKVAEDALTEALGFDDSRIAKVTAFKVHTTGQFAWCFELTPTERP